MMIAIRSHSICPETAGTWVAILSTDGCGAMLACPEAHFIGILPGTVGDDGWVNRNVRCGECGWEDTVVLSGWNQLTQKDSLEAVG